MSDPTDEQIEAAMLVAMRKAVDRQTDPDRRAGMRRELERVEAGEHVPDDMKPEMMRTIRDFVAALAALMAAPKVRRRNIPAEQAAAIADRVAAREAKKLAKRGRR